MKHIFIYLTLILLISYCKKNEEILKDESGAIIKKPYLWSKKLIDKDGVGFLTIPVPVYNGKILLSGNLNSFPYFFYTDLKGYVIWKKQFEYADISLTQSYQYKDNLIFRGKKGRIYNINIESNSLLWQNSYNVYFWHWISGLENLFFVGGSKIDSLNNPYLVHSAWIGNAITGEIYDFYTPKLVPINPNNLASIGIGGVERILPVKDNNGDLLLTIFVNKYSINSSDDSSYFGLYNYSKENWIYDKIQLGSVAQGVMGKPQIFNNKVYVTTTDDLACFDLYTGNLVWRGNYNNIFSSFGHVIADGIIYVMIDGSEKAVVAHNVENGAFLWKTQVHGTISNMHYLNGVVYFSSTGDGRLYAIDGQTGKILWKIQSPDGHGFIHECAVIPGENGEKGRVISKSWWNAYCFEAER